MQSAAASVGAMLRGGAAALGAGAVLLAAGCLAASAYAAPVGAYTTKGAWHFVSAPSLHPPKLKVLSRHAGLAPGDFLVANLPNEAAAGPMTGQGGPIIFNKKLQPVWSYPVGTRIAAANLQQETYQGSPVLVWWEGLVNSAGVTTKGEVVVVNKHYRRIATLKAASPWVVSLHDAFISGSNIWVTVYRQVSGTFGHWKGTVLDAGIQEYDLKSGKLLYTWDALNPGGTANVPLSDSKQQPPTPKEARSGAVWDAYHLNSLQVLPDGRILFSMRNTWAVYLLDPATNKILWTLGGKSSSFRSPPNARFAWQHDAELLTPADGGVGTSEELSLFNDDCTWIGKVSCSGPSEGMILRLNTVSDEATLVAAYPHTPPLQAEFLGSMQVLPNGNALVGWGSPYSYFSEYSKSGKQLLNVQWPGKDESYRALYTDNWVGTPYYPPRGAVRRSKGKTIVYASWNGATQVTRWEVLGGSSAKHLKIVAKHRRSGFETAVKLRRAYTFYEVRALNSHGKVIRKSKPFR